MAGRARWIHLGRVEPEEPEATTERDRLFIAQVKLTLKAGCRQTFEVRLDDRLLGEVQTNFRGQSYKPEGGTPADWRVAGFRWNSQKDPKHGLGILALAEHWGLYAKQNALTQPMEASECTEASPMNLSQ